MQKEIGNRVKTLTEVSVSAPIAVFGLQEEGKEQPYGDLLSDVESVVSEFKSNKKCDGKLSESVPELSEAQQNTLIKEINTVVHKYDNESSASSGKAAVMVRTLNIF